MHRNSSILQELRCSEFWQSGTWRAQMLLLREYTQKCMGSAWSRHLVFGFEEGHNTEQIVVGLMLLVQRGVEWHHVRPVSIFSADVKAALDEFSIETIIDFHMYRQFPAELIAAIFEETVDLTAIASIQDVHTPSEFDFNRRAKQCCIEVRNTVLRHELDLRLDRA